MWSVPDGDELNTMFRHPKAHHGYWDALQERRKRHRLQVNLCNLSDVELMDNGITRGEVDHVVLNISIDPRGARSTPDARPGARRQMTLVTEKMAQSGIDEMSFRYAGWRAVLACFLLALFIFGFGLYGHGVYVAELQRLHGWPPALISSASSLTFLLSSVFQRLQANS